MHNADGTLHWRTPPPDGGDGWAGSRQADSWVLYVPPVLPQPSSTGAVFRPVVVVVAAAAPDMMMLPTFMD